MGRKKERETQRKPTRAPKSRGKKSVPIDTSTLPRQDKHPNLLTGGVPGNSGGKKGRSGMRSNWLVRFSKRMVKAQGTRKAVRGILTNPNNPAFSAMYKEVARRAYGEVAKDLNVNARVSLEDLVGGSYQEEGT